MKKSLAVASASALGLGVVALSPSVAVADPVTDLCADVNEHAPGSELHDNWFMDCVPQFGLGKVEFTVFSNETLPPDFLPLDDPAVSSVASAGAAAYSYLGMAPESVNGFVDFSQGADMFSYGGSMIFPIADVSAFDPLNLPAACLEGGATYTHAYQVDYEPVTITFTQTAGGDEWTVTVSVTPPSVYLGFNFVLTGPVIDNAIDPFCVSSGALSYRSGPVVSEEGLLAESWPFLDDFGGFIDGGQVMYPYLLDMSQQDPLTPVIGDFEITRVPRDLGPGLADTGAEISPLLLGAGAIALLGGAGLFVASRVQRRRRDSA